MRNILILGFAATVFFFICNVNIAKTTDLAKLNIEALSANENFQITKVNYSEVSERVQSVICHNKNTGQDEVWLDKYIITECHGIGSIECEEGEKYIETLFIKTIECDCKK